MLFTPSILLLFSHFSLSVEVTFTRKGGGMSDEHFLLKQSRLCHLAYKRPYSVCRYDNVVSRGASVPMQQLHHSHGHHHMQQPHTLRLPADSSSSSQSSGYGSANFNNQSRDSRQHQRPQSQEDALAARPPRPTTLFQQQRKRGGSSRSRNNEGMLTLEDSQMI